MHQSILNDFGRYTANAMVQTNSTVGLYVQEPMTFSALTLGRFRNKTSALAFKVV